MEYLSKVVPLLDLGGWLLILIISPFYPFSPLFFFCLENCIFIILRLPTPIVTFVIILISICRTLVIKIFNVKIFFFMFGANYYDISLTHEKAVSILNWDSISGFFIMTNHLKHYLILTNKMLYEFMKINIYDLN